MFGFARLRGPSGQSQNRTSGLSVDFFRGPSMSTSGGRAVAQDGIDVYPLAQITVQVLAQGFGRFPP